MDETAQLQEPKEFVRWRAVLLGAVLSVVFSAINGYLSINLGMNFGYGAVAVILAYSLFHIRGGGSCRRELSYVLIASTSQMATYQTLAFILYMTETDPTVSFPGWLSPARDVILAKDLTLSLWLKPLGFLIFTMAVSMAAGVIFHTVLRDELNRGSKMIWPSQSATTKLVDACMEGGGSARLVALAAVIGFAVTMAQYLPSIWGIDLTTLDLSGLLPRGAYLVIFLSVAFTSIGYLISPRTSLSLLGSGLLTYLVASPILVSRGALEYTPDIMAFYNDMLYGYTLSPAIGVMLLGGILLSVFALAKATLFKGKEKVEESEAGYLELFKVLVKGITGNKVYLAATVGIFILLASLAYVLNPFAPLSPWFAVGFTFYSFFIAGFLELVFIAKISAETGMGVGVMSMLLYDLPIFSAGYRGYTGYWAYPFFRPNPWLGSGSLPYYKYRDETRVSWRDIILAKVTGWVPTVFFSVFLTLVLWKYVGFGTEMMPSVGLIQSKVYVTMLATGNVSSVLNPWTFVAGGVLGALLELFTPVSMMGIGMGLFLPPHYVVPFGVGGLIRVYTDRRYGKKFYEEKGRLVVTGLMASSLLVQVLMTVVTNFL